MATRGLQEEVNGGATTGKWDRMKVAGQGEEIKWKRYTGFRKSLARSEPVNPGGGKRIASARPQGLTRFIFS
jgi:hypothetical protein